MREVSSEATFGKGRCKELARHSRVRLTAKAFYKGMAAVLLACPPISASEARPVTSISGVIRCHAVSELAKVRVMAKGEVPSPPEQEAEEECLHCAIVALVEARIAAGGADAANLAALIVESLVDLILRVPEEEQAQFLAQTLSALGDLFLQKSGLVGEGSGSTH